MSLATQKEHEVVIVHHYIDLNYLRNSLRLLMLAGLSTVADTSCVSPFLHPSLGRSIQTE